MSPALFSGGLHEMVGETPGDFTAATAFALIASVQDRQATRPLLFAALASDSQEHGLLYGHGVRQLGIDPDRILLLQPRSEKELLWAAEEAVSCNALGGAVVVLPAALDEWPDALNA